MRGIFITRVYYKECEISCVLVKKFFFHLLRDQTYKNNRELRKENPIKLETRECEFNVKKLQTREKSMDRKINLLCEKLLL